MAFPIVQTSATTNGTTASATATVNLPTGIVSGETLVGILRTAVAGAHGWPAGWTELFDSTADASDDNTSCAWRKADGTEGATISVSQGNGKYAAIVYRISGATDPTVTPPEFAALATGTSATPDPGALSPTGGAKDYLWLWLGGWEGEQTSPPAGTPTNYTDALGASSGVAGAITTNCRVASARRNLNAASEDPPFWSISVSDDWTATVVALHPSPSQTFFQTLAATELAVLTLTAVAIFVRTLAATEVATAALARVATFLRTLAATEVAAPALSTVSTFLRSLAAVELAVAALAKAQIFPRALAATAGSVATLSSALLKVVSMAATEVTAATLTRVTTFVRTLALSEISVATMTPVATFVRTLTAAAGSTATVLAGLFRVVSLAATAVAAMGRTFKVHLPDVVYPAKKPPVRGGE